MHVLRLRWIHIEPFAVECLGDWLARSQHAALAKIRAEHEHEKLMYEAKLAHYRRVLAQCQCIIKHAWVGKKARLEYMSRRSALGKLQRAWHRACSRRRLQREIAERVKVSSHHMKVVLLPYPIARLAAAISRSTRCSVGPSSINVK